MSEFLQFTSCPYSLHVSGTQNPHLHKIDKSSTTTRSKSRSALISSVFEKMLPIQQSSTEKWKSLFFTLHHRSHSMKNRFPLSSFPVKRSATTVATFV